MDFAQYAIHITYNEIAMGTDQQFFKQLNKLRGSATVIVGVGNTLKGDDAAGPIVCQQLGGKVRAELIDAGTVPENYIQTIIKKSPRNLLIIDAVDFGARPGTINIFRPEQLKSTAFSTHTLSPRLFVDMVCKDIDADVYFVGIQPAQTQLGESQSTQVNQAIQSLVRVLTEIFPLSE